MAYQLRSRKDPATAETQEQPDTPVENLTEIQVTTSSQTMFVPPLLSEQEHIALPIAEASQSQIISDIPTNASSLLDLKGPTRFDPDLGSATVSVGLLPPADTVGPPSTVMSSRDISLTGNQPSQLYDTIDTSSLSLIHDSQEVKHTQTIGTTLHCRPIGLNFQNLNNSVVHGLQAEQISYKNLPVMFQVTLITTSQTDRQTNVGQKIAPAPTGGPGQREWISNSFPPNHTTVTRSGYEANRLHFNPLNARYSVGLHAR